MSWRGAIAGLFGVWLSVCGAATGVAQTDPVTGLLDALYRAGKHREALATVDVVADGGAILVASEWLRKKVEAGAPYPYAERIGHLLRSRFPAETPLQQTAAAYIAYAGIIALRESIRCADRTVGERTVAEIEARGAKILATIHDMPTELRFDSAKTAITFEIENESRRDRGEMLCDAFLPEAYWKPLELAARRAVIIVPERFMQIKLQ
jgi:hypothetical protein